MISDYDMPNDKITKGDILLGAKLILVDILADINTNDLTVSQIRGLINNNIDEIEGLINE